MATNPKDLHRGHPKMITPLPNAGQGPGRHYGRIDCRLCGVFVSWASKQQVLRGVDYYNKG
jgi:hypothetical protein